MHLNGTISTHQDGNKIANFPRMIESGDLYEIKVNISLVVQLGNKSPRLHTSTTSLNRGREKLICNEVVSCSETSIPNIY